MYMNKIFKYLLSLTLLAGCSGTDKTTSVDWFDGYDTDLTGTPHTMQYGRPSDGYGTHDTLDETHNMCVMLPLTGQHAPIGQTIRQSITAAVLQNAPNNLSVNFYDTNENISDTITTVLNSDPDVIIGPLFANDARALRSAKPEHIPVLSFTSDATAVGDGVITMSLMPTNGVETIIREMQNDGANKFIILAPNNESGRLMAGTAKNAASIYDLELMGIFYYTPRDTDSIKNTASAASMNTARTAAHTRARTVLSDILINERLTTLEKSKLNIQLEKLSKSETVGNIPYNAVLFLGDGDDTKSLASFLRYYDVAARDARFYGTTMWDGSDIASDFTMTGSKYATLPETDYKFSAMYEQIYGTAPNRLATIGYDAANMAIGMIYSDKTNVSYLLDPSGYVGTDGLFRLKPTGDNERALRIVELTGDGNIRETKPAATDFIKPLYNIEQRHISPAAPMELTTNGIDPDDYISIPEHLRNKYRSKTIGANTTKKSTAQKSQLISIQSDDTGDAIVSENYTPIKLEKISQEYIDEYEIEE